jgi:hypothetical protein
MPPLDEVSYDQATTVAAVRSYFVFLTNMYLDEADVLEPPEEGWPTITAEVFQALNKSDTVISLLGHLPYIRMAQLEDEQPQGAPFCTFCDWQLHATHFVPGSAPALKITSELHLKDKIPPQVVSLTSGSRDNPVILIDTELGIIYWSDCPDEVRDSSTQEQTEDDPYSWAPEEETTWRGDAPAWTITDFFEMLKDQFRKLRFIPISISPNSPRVIDDYSEICLEPEGMVPMLQKIYREYGWPELDQFRKEDCRKAIRKAMEEQYPDFDC